MHNARTKPPIRPVLLAGGTGARLWPVSRASMPKQFARVFDGDTLFQATVRRVSGEGFAPPVVVAAEPFRFIVLEQLDAIGADCAAVLVEPEPKNTAPAVASAVAWALEADPESALLMLPTDHAVDDTVAFRETVLAACGTPGLVAFGVAPTRAETGFGWLECDATGDGPTLPRRFVEKPDAATAEAFLASGRHLWNAGMTLGGAAAFAHAFAAHAPEIWGAATAALREARADLGFLRLARAPYEAIRPQPFDTAVLEKAGGLSVVRLDAGWSDLGAWDAVAERGTGNGQGVTAIDCRGSYLRAEDGLHLVGIGLEDMIAVAVADGVLVAPRERAQDVRRAVDAMIANGIPQGAHHPVDHRPWGWFQTLILGERFRVKRIVVKPGGRLSLQSHEHRAEHWVVVEGTAQVTIGENRRRLGENQSIYVPVGAKHRLENESGSDVVLIEVQTGAYLGEDDITRYDDAYARE